MVKKQELPKSIILSQTVEVRWTGKIKNWYISKGYEFTKMGDFFEVKIEDLTQGSRVEVNIQCTMCKDKFSKPYQDIARSGHTFCFDCAVRRDDDGKLVSEYTCSDEFCNLKARERTNGKPYCWRHAAQVRLYGYTFKTHHDEQKYIQKGDVTEIVLLNRKLEEAGRAIVDTKNVEKLKKYRWYLNYSPTPHAKAHIRKGGKSKMFNLGRFLMNPDKGDVVVPKDGNTLNYLEENLLVMSRGDFARQFIVKKEEGIKDEF